MIKRLFLYLVAALCAFAVCASAFASAPTKQYADAEKRDLWHDGLGAACNWYTGYLSGDAAGRTTSKGADYGWTGTCTQTSTEPVRIEYACTNGGPWPKCTPGSTSGENRYFYSRMWCTGSGTAPDTSKPLNEQCAAPPPPQCSDKNPFVRRWNYPASSSGSFPAPSHYAGCVVTPMEMMVCRKDTTGTYCMWMVKRTGDVYSGPDTPGAGGNDTPEKPQDPPTTSPPVKPPANQPPGTRPCPTGTVQAGVDSAGTPICMGTGSNPPNKPPLPPKIESEQTTNNPDGSTTTTKTTTTTNSDGSTTKTVTITNTSPTGVKSESTTKDTSANTSGGAGRDDTAREDDKYDMCKQNPMLSVCRNSSVSGTCGEITCEGDAIQCATLRAAAAMQCQQQKDLDNLTARPEVAAGNAILGGADPMKGAIDSALKGTEVDMSQPNLDAGGFVSSRACLAPRSFAVAGKSITVDFGELCDSIEALRYAVLACAWIVAYLIVSRSVLNS